MKLIKTLIKKSLENFGYSVIKIDQPTKRVVINAHYKGKCFHCFKDDPLSDDLLTGKDWDPQLSDILRQLKEHKKGDIIEIGANIGASFLPIAAKFPEFHFHCIEPVPDFYQLLEKNAQSFKSDNVTLYNKAIGSKDGDTIDILVGLGTAGLSQLVHYQMAGETLKVESCRLDTLMKERKPILLKIDVDGHEFNVLKSTTEILEKHHPWIFIEFATRVMSDLGIDPNEMVQFFKDSSYTTIDIWDNEGQFIKTTQDWSEMLTLAEQTPHYLNILIKS